MPLPMPAPREILNLIDRFDRNAEDYRAAPYNEANVRQELINPFFECLGWDIDNKRGASGVWRLTSAEKN
jgi:hypothetical protein